MQSINYDDILEYRKNFDADSFGKVVQNAVTTTALSDLALNRSVLQNTNVSSFTTQLDDWASILLFFLPIKQQNITD